MAKHRVMSENNVSVVKFENNTVPAFKEVRGKEWVSYGDKNDYPNYLLTLFNRSAKHNAIVTGKVHYIKGKGFLVKEEGLNVEQRAKLENFLKNINDNDTADELLYKVSTDLELFGGFAVQVIPNMMKTGIAQVCHIDFSKLRVDKTKEKIWYCNDWSNPKEETGLMELTPFDEKKFSGVYYFTQYRPGIQNYPMPEYIGCIPYIEMDYEISNFHLNNIKNGFSAGTMISFNNGEPEAEAKGRIEKLVKKKTTGTDNAGQLLIVYSDGKDSAPTVTALTPNNFDKLFDTLNQTVQQEIFTGHKITSPMLFGIKTEGQLGGSTEIRESAELFQNSYVAAKQSMIENEFNYLMEVAGYGPVLEIQPIDPISFQVSEQSLLQVLTVDEIRAKLGYAPKEAQQAQSMHKFSSQDEIEVFKKYGFSKKEFEVLKSEEVEDKEEANLKELAFYIHRQSFDKDDDVIGPNNPDPSDIIRTPGTPKTERIEVMYSYEVRKGLGEPIIEGTRDLCRKLIELDKFYTRADITKMSKELGYDVWEKRGGFYHNPKTDVTTPYCRHIWNQNLVRKNG